MKTNNETANAFVNGYNSKSGNFYTDGQTATSYNTDIATHFGGVILLAANYRCMNFYSYGYFYGRTNTTERHKSEIKREARKNGVQVYEVPNIAIWSRKEHENNYQYLKAQAVEFDEKATRARKLENVHFYANEAAKRHVIAARYWNLFLAD